MYKIVTIILIFCSGYSNQHSVAKRSLVFTRAAVLQFTYGLSVPLVLPRRSINFSLATQANYNLPYNVSQLQVKTIAAREKYSFLDLSREKFYRYIASLFDSFGLNGEECLLRSICEISEHPMHLEDDGLLEKIVHYLFTPSLDFDIGNYNISLEEENLPFSDKVLLAEKIGRKQGKCGKKFSDCIIPLTDFFTMKYII